MRDVLQYQDYTYGNNLKLRYAVLGEGRTVLFLHGGGLDSRTYAKNIELLARRYKVIAPDIPFFGRSHPPDSRWNFKDYAVLFSQFIDSLDINNIMLIGHSFGGGIALELVAINSRISKLVLIDSAGIPPNYSKTKFLCQVVIKSINNFLYSDKIMALTVIIHFMQNIFRSFFLTPKKFNIVQKSIYTKFENFEKIKIPTLILWGKKDNIYPMEYAKSFNNLILGSDLMLVDGGHDWLLLASNAFSDLIT